MTRVVEPGSTLGVFGGGQLGRMFAIAAQQMGYRVHVYVSSPGAPAASVAHQTTVAAYEDLDAVDAFARQVDAVTLEFENIEAQAVVAAERHTPARPGPVVLQTAQNRLAEKTFLQKAGLPVSPFVPVRSLQNLEQGLMTLGTPAVLKTAAWGYDGKGQVKLDTPEQAASAWQSLDTDEAVLEQFVDFDCELSVIVVRGLDGQIEHVGPIENEHRHHILDVSIAPARVDAPVQHDAVQVARAAAEQLDLVGVLCVEMFLGRDGQVLINELAPRPHNSGHLTIDAHVTSQFEQQVRAMCGLPLGRFHAFGPAAMANLLGDLWSDGTPRWEQACAFPDLKLHLYGKAEARPGRKMGHLTTVADDTDTARQRVLDARAALTGQTSTAGA